MSVNNEYFDDIVSTFGQFYRENGGNWGTLKSLFEEAKFDDEALFDLMKKGRDESDVNLVALANLIRKLSKEQKSQLEAKSLAYAKATA